jgi:hypothetical protein
MTETVSDQLEMRKLEQLSNTIFGVAMTLLAYDLPKAAQFDYLPDWRDLYHAQCDLSDEITLPAGSRPECNA